MLALIWGVFAWLRSFIRSRHDLGLEIVALRQQLIVLKPGQSGPTCAVPTDCFGFCCAERGRSGQVLF
jgi:hypothetical protein